MNFKLETSGIIRRRAFAPKPLQQKRTRDFSSLQSCVWHQAPTTNASTKRFGAMDAFIDAIPLCKPLKVSEIAQRANLTPKAAANALYRAMEIGYDIVRINHGKNPARYVRNK